jgi:hypothetical protein
MFHKITRIHKKLFVTVHREVKVYKRVWKLSVLRNILLTHMDTQGQSSCSWCMSPFSLCAGLSSGQLFDKDFLCNYLLVHVCYTARSKYAKLLCWNMLHCSVEICYTIPSKHAICRIMLLFGGSILHCYFELYYTIRSRYATFLGPSMLHCSIEVCYNSRSKYVALFGPSLCYTAQSKYATVLTHLTGLASDQYD